MEDSGSIWSGWPEELIERQKKGAGADLYVPDVGAEAVSELEGRGLGSSQLLAVGCDAGDVGNGESGVKIHGEKSPPLPQNARLERGTQEC